MNFPTDYQKLTGNLKASRFRHGDLDANSRKMLGELSKIESVYRYSPRETDTIKKLGLFLALPAFGLLLVVAFGVDIITDVPTRIAVTFAAFLIGLPLAYGLHVLWRSARAPLPTQITLTPMYAIQTDEHQVKFWGMWAMSGVLETDVYVNGIYSTTKIEVLFPDDELKFAIRGESNVRAFVQTVNAWKAICEEAIAQQRWDYFAEYDVLKGFAVEQRAAGTMGNDRKPTRLFFGEFTAKHAAAYVLIALLAGQIAVSMGLGMREADKSRKELLKKMEAEKRRAR